MVGALVVILCPSVAGALVAEASVVETLVELELVELELVELALAAGEPLKLANQ